MVRTLLNGLDTVVDKANATTAKGFGTCFAAGVIEGFVNAAVVYGVGSMAVRAFNKITGR